MMIKKSNFYLLICMLMTIFGVTSISYAESSNGSLKSSSADAWEHIKQGFSEAYNAFYESWKKSKKEFGSDQ